MIVMAIGDNIGRGLGILGALAIIRFRTTLRQPRDIVFMFCALGIGMACGMYGFNIAVIGTISFSVFAILFRLSPYHAMRHTKYQLRINIPLNTEIGLIQIESILSKYFKRFILQRKDIVKDKKEESKEIQYLLGSECMDESAFIKELKLLHEELNVRYWMRNENASD